MASGQLYNWDRLTGKTDSFGYEVFRVTHVAWHEGHRKPKAVALIFKLEFLGALSSKVCLAVSGEISEHDSKHLLYVSSGGCIGQDGSLSGCNSIVVLCLSFDSLCDLCD